MDNIFEYIIPIIFAVIYLFGSKLSKKAEEVFDQTSEDTGVDDRQRQIQEEIRRKIRQRRGGSPDQAEVWREYVRRGDASRTSPSNSLPKTEAGVDVPESEAELFTSPRDSFALQLQARLERVEATKKQAQELQKLGANNIASNSRPDTRSRTGGLFSGSVRSTLRDPAAARAAFIYAEVLGTPVSQKKASSVPGLS